MTSFFATSFEYFSNRPQNVCAVVSSTRPIFHSSIIPVTLSTKELWMKLSNKTDEAEGHYETRLFPIFIQSDTMQFSSRIVIRSLHIHPNWISFIFSTLINRRRYFIRTIKHLTLSQPCINNSRSLTQICNKLPALQSLNLSGCKLHYDDIDRVASQLVCLRELDLSDTAGYSCATFKLLQKMKMLQSLTLINNHSVNRAAMIDISEISSLHKLDVSRSSVSSDYSSELTLAFNSNLQVLKIGGTLMHVNDQDLSKIGELRYLQVLDLSYCDDITDIGLQHLSQCTLVSTLNLLHCSRLSCYCLNTVFSHLPALEDVGVDVSLADPVFPDLLSNLKSISKVELRTLGSPTDEQIDLLCKTVTNLQMLRIEEGSRLTSLKPLVNLRHLTGLFIYDLTKDTICQGLTSIGTLQNLASLAISNATQDATFGDIDLSVLRNLKLLNGVVFRHFPGLSVTTLHELLPSVQIVISHS